MQMKSSENFLNNVFLDIKLGWKYQCKLVISSLIVFIYFITNVIKQIQIVVYYIQILLIE